MAKTFQGFPDGWSRILISDMKKRPLFRLILRHARGQSRAICGAFAHILKPERPRVLSRTFADRITGKAKRSASSSRLSFMATNAKRLVKRTPLKKPSGRFFSKGSKKSIGSHQTSHLCASSFAASGAANASGRVRRTRLVIQPERVEIGAFVEMVLVLDLLQPARQRNAKNQRRRFPHDL